MTRMPMNPVPPMTKMAIVVSPLYPGLARSRVGSD
jgi:hypothetical protein